MRFTASRFWSVDDDARLILMTLDCSHAEMAVALDRTVNAVRNRCHYLGYTRDNAWTCDEVAALRAAYLNRTAIDIDLGGLAARFERSKANVCRKARELGLTDKSRPRLHARKDRRKFKGDSAALRAHTSASRKLWHQANEHPRGMRGKRHTEATLARLSAASRAWNASLTGQQKAAMAMKAMKTKEARGIPLRHRTNTTWKAAWREIGGTRKFYRSRWEANYARYLEWLKASGQVIEWRHEPKTFWFEGVRRGAVSYLPDFCVTERGGREVYHEVKGWMDARSATKIKRMAKYHPTVRLIVIRQKQYRAIERAVSALISGWELSR